MSAPTFRIEPSPVEFWDACAPHLAAIEDHYMDRASARGIAREIRGPVLVVGAGQGLIVEELQKQGLECDGVDYSAEMIRYARIRRGLTLVYAEARSLPFAPGSYETVIYPTGVLDFTSDEDEIRAILAEGRRVASESGTLFVAFYKLSSALEDLLKRLGLLKNHVVRNRESLESYLLNPVQSVNWAAKKAGVSRLKGMALLGRTWALSTMHERRLVFRMQRLFRRMHDPDSVIKLACETLPYRNQEEIRNLFERLAVPIRQVRRFSGCTIVKLQSSTRQPGDPSR